MAIVLKSWLMAMFMKENKLQGMKHGKGKFYWFNGAKYEGGFKNDLMDGKGTYSRPDGSEYIGGWK